MTTLLLDYDPVLYVSASVGEKRTILAVHHHSGDEYEFANRTAFWGHHKKKAGGWLAEYNAAKKDPANYRKAEDFDITDVQTPEPISKAITTIKSQIQGLKETLGADNYYGYTGKGEVFRVDVSTIVKYKGNRDGVLRPILLDELKDYVVSKHGCKIVTRIEADDACSMDSYEAWVKFKKSGDEADKKILAFVDKDYWQCAGFMYNTNWQEPVCGYDGFGWLKLNDKGDVRGRGRMWLYFQVLSGDDADNYFANSATEMKWGDKAAFNLLKDCTNDKEAFTALVAGYKTLYPSPKIITGWRGDAFEIDWLYVLQENFTLAKMLRWEGDKIDVQVVLEKLGVVN